jgi:hypothetical protein
MHPTRRYRTRILAGRSLLALAAVLYAVALAVPMFGDQDETGWMVFGVVAKSVPVLYAKGEPGWAASLVGLVYVNAVAGAAALALALGWIGFARVAGVLALTAFWATFACLYVSSPALASFGDFLSICRGAWLWFIAIYLVALAAFVTPRRPRRPAED